MSIPPISFPLISLDGPYKSDTPLSCLHKWSVKHTPNGLHLALEKKQLSEWVIAYLKTMAEAVLSF